LVQSCDQPLLLGLQFDAPAQDVDTGDDTLFILIDGIVDQRLSGLNPRADGIRRRGVGDHEKIGASSGKHDQVAVPFVGILRRELRLRSRFPALDVGPVEDALRKIGTRVFDGERSHHRGYVDTGDL
jgi:hypothetical protein